MPAPLEPSSGTSLAVRGMSCGNCVRKVGEALRAVPGVDQAQVDLPSGTARIRWKPGVVPNVDVAIRAATEAGFQVSLSVESTDAKPAAWLGGWKSNTLIASMGAIVLLLIGHLPGLSSQLLGIVSLLVGGAVQVVCGARFYRAAWLQARKGRSSMDTLVAIGSTTAFGYSAGALWLGPGASHSHLYFSEAAGIIAFISLGHWLESMASAKAEGALRALFKLAPETATQVDPDGASRQVPVGALAVGDLVRVSAGERIPIDGEIREGTTEVDESMLTGESVPVVKTVGSRVYGGTMNGGGSLLCAVAAIGRDTALARITEAVERSQSSRAKVQRLADRISDVFVPTVVALAVATALAWGLAYETMHAWTVPLETMLWTRHVPASPWAAGLIHACALLIVACPCAMGLATPAAIMAGTNAGARRGILIRDAQAIETAGAVDVVMFDKTGTLTQGKPELCGWFDVANPQPGQCSSHSSPLSGLPLWWPLARAVADRSKHPACSAILSVTSPTPPVEGADSISFWNVREIPGCGVEAIVSDDSGSVVRLGSLKWLKEEGVVLDAASQAWLEGPDGRGASATGFSRGSRLLGLITMRDRLKAGVPEMVRRLANSGVRAGMISGDRKEVVMEIARLAGISPDLVFSEIGPEGKSKIIQGLQEQGHRVAFVGDGLNDGPALAQASLGIAVSQASDVAREAAGLILLKTGVEAVPESLELASRTLRTIRENLLWAFFYNAAAVPLAALGFLSPVVCAAAMGLSDLMVIGNSLRLLRWRSRR